MRDRSTFGDRDGPGSAAHHHSARKTRVNALMVLRCARDTRPALAEVESLLPHERAEIGALRHAVLSRLVLRPAIERNLAPARRIAWLVGMDRSAALVV